MANRNPYAPTGLLRLLNRRYFSAENPNGLRLASAIARKGARTVPDGDPIDNLPGDMDSRNVKEHELASTKASTSPSKLRRAEARETATQTGRRSPLGYGRGPSKRLSRNVWRGWMAGARCDSGRLSKPVWTASCGPRPPASTIAVTRRVTKRSDREEWRVIEPYLPPARTTGRPRAWPMREIVNAIFYVLRGGMAWRLLPIGLSAVEHGLPLVRGLA